MSKLDQLQQILAANPGDADVLYMIAHEHAKAGNARAAVEWYGRCLGVDPEYHYAYYHKARALESLDDVPGALATLRSGLARATAARNAKAVSEIGASISALGG